MGYPTGGELPPELERVHRKAIRLEWISIGYLLSATAAVFFTLGSSQAMKGAWLEDTLSLAPPIAFLVAARIRYPRARAAPCQPRPAAGSTAEIMSPSWLWSSLPITKR
jgi:hypothetical protein